MLLVILFTIESSIVRLASLDPCSYMRSRARRTFRSCQREGKREEGRGERCCLVLSLCCLCCRAKGAGDRGTVTSAETVSLFKLECR